MEFSQFAFAIVQIVLSSICTLLQFSVLPLFFLFADYRTRVSHQMMFSLGLFDCTQLVSHFIGGLFFVCQAQMPVWLGKIAAATNLVGGIAMLLQHMLLAANRLVAICSPVLWPTLMESKAVEKCFRMLEALLWVGLFAFLVVFQTTLIGGKFDGAVFTIDDTLPFSWLYSYVLFYMNLIGPGSSLCMYIAIFGVVKMNKYRAQLHQQSSAMCAKERRLLFQALILFVGLSLQNFSLVASTECEEQLLILFLFFYCALNPLLYLTMSKEFRERYWRTYRIKFFQHSQSTTAAVAAVKPAGVVQAWPPNE